ncbi:MAG: PQQ-binding-like beta-propeller repeat protein [Planctomycetota bacterium]
MNSRPGSLMPLTVRLAMPAILLALFQMAPGPRLLAQERSFLGWDQIEEDDYQFDPDRSEVATFAIQVSGEVRFRFYRASELMKLGRFREASEPLQEVINLFPNHLYQVAKRPPRWVGAAEYARFLLSSFPPEGREEYAAWAALRVAPKFKKALATRDEELLGELADRWVATPEGLESLRLLGDLEQERGNHELAERYYRRRLLFEDPPLESTPKIAFRAAAALALQGRPGRGAELAEPYGSSEIRLGGELLDLPLGVGRLSGLAEPRGRDWAVFGGSPDHGGIVPGTVGKPRLSKEWHVPVFSPIARNPFSIHATDSDQGFPFHAAISRGSILLADGLTIRSYTFFSDEPRWVFHGPLAGTANRVDFYQFEDYLGDRQKGEYRIGQLARQLPLMTTVADGVVLSCMFDLQPRGQRILLEGLEITEPIPRRSLHAVDLRTGRLLWQQHQEELGAQALVNRLSVSAPPIVVGDRVIAAGHILEGAINHYVVCFSLSDGRLLWKTPIVVGQQELTMFNKTFKEFSVQMPAEQDGSVFVCTNLGLIAALDLVTGNLRWVTQYESIPIMGARHYYRPMERSTSSNNDAPVVRDGVAVFSPLDSSNFYALDVATGKRLWVRDSGQRYPLGYRYLLGVDGDTLVLGGDSGIGFFDLKSGATLGEFSIADPGSTPPWPRGCLGEGVVCQPLMNQLLILRWTRAGSRVEVRKEAVPIDSQQAGNLVLYQDFQITVSQDLMTVFFDVDALVAEARRKALTEEQSDEDLILLGDLEHLKGDYLASIRSFEQVFARGEVDAETSRRVRDGLYRSHRELARRATDSASRLEHLQAEARYAADARDFLASAEQILAVLDEKKDYAGYLETLDWIDQRCADVDFPFSLHPFGGLVRVGLFTLEQRSLVALVRGRPGDATAAWQKMILQYDQLPFGGSTAGRYAERKIAEAIETYGPEVFEPFEREAAELHRVAMETRDSRALGDLIRCYPNSRDVDSRRLDLARLLLDEGKHGEAFEVVAPLLNDGEGRAHALYLGARGAELAGEPGLARALWARLGEIGRDTAALGGEGESYGSVAARELERLGPAAPGGRLGQRLASLPDLVNGVRRFPLVLDPDTHMVPLLGARSEILADAVMVYEVAPDRGAAHAWLRLIDVGRLEESWRVLVDSYFSESDPLKAYLFGDRIVVRQRRKLRGYRAETGELLFERTLPAVPALEEQGDNLLYMQWRRPDGASVLAAVELASGTFFWSKETGNDPYDLVVTSELVLTQADGMVTARDALTGTTRYSLSLLEVSRRTGIRAFEEFGLLVAIGVGQGANSPTLIGFDLSDGRRLFEKERLPKPAEVGWLQALPEGLVLLRGNGSFLRQRAKGIHTVELLEPRTGRVLWAVPDLPQLSVFDHGETSLAGKVVLLAGSHGSHRNRTNRRVAMVVVEAGRQDPWSIPLDGLPNDWAEFTSFATRKNSLFGTIDVKPQTIPKGNKSFVYTLDLESGSLNVERIPSEQDYYWSSPTCTSNALVVLKDGQLHIYPAREAGEDSK